MNSILTPTNISSLQHIIYDQLLGTLSPPVYTYNIQLYNPFYGEMKPLNTDPKYQKRMVDYYYTKLTEKWLYRDSAFKKLLPYFNLKIDGTSGKVSLVENIDKLNNENIDEKNRKYIFRYIERVFVNKRFVDKVIRQYVKRTDTNWYDLVRNNEAIKKLLAHKLKKLIIHLIDKINDV